MFACAGITLRNSNFLNPTSYFFQLIGSRRIGYYQPPANGALRRLMLMVVLRGQWSLDGMNDFVSTSLASVYSRPWNDRAGVMQLVKRFVVPLLQDIGILVERHFFTLRDSFGLASCSPAL